VHAGGTNKIPKGAITVPALLEQFAHQVDLAATKVTPPQPETKTADSKSAVRHLLLSHYKKERPRHPGSGPCALLLSTVNLCDLRNALHFPFNGHVFLQPDVCPPPSDKRRSGDHCKRNS
jgi:hypothetical protein